MIPAPLETKICEYKKKYPEVLHTTGPSLEGDGDILHIVCRPLSMYEASYHGELVYRDEESAQEFVVKVGTLAVYSSSKKEFILTEDLPIGLFGDVYQIILENSGYGDLESLIQNINFFRSVVNQPHIMAMSFICKAFSGYTPRDIENMSVTELAKHIVLAEQIHEAPFEIATADQIAEQEKQEESSVMNNIKREARQNDRIMGNKRFIDFSQDNTELKGAMG